MIVAIATFVALVGVGLLLFDRGDHRYTTRTLALIGAIALIIALLMANMA
jgi:hypothetical protein